MINLRGLKQFLVISSVLMFLSIGIASAQQGQGIGEVRRVDNVANKITIKHGEISTLELPAMTLVFEANASLMAKVKVGDQVQFTAVHQNGKYILTSLDKK